VGATKKERTRIEERKKNGFKKRVNLTFYFFLSGGEDRMDEGRALESLLKFLPQDLSDFVSTDNDAFRQEIINWDKVPVKRLNSTTVAPA
jgi:hypothetical protein